jgi:hypothetical protein
MPKLNTNHHDDLQNHQGKTLNDLLNDSEQSSDGTLDFSICGGRQLPAHDAGIHPERPSLAGHEEPVAQLPTKDFFASEAPHGTHGTKQSRQAVDVATQLSMERHGWKQTGEPSPLRVFEHRWPHMRDRSEGRNHGVQGR